MMWCRPSTFWLGRVGPTLVTYGFSSREWKMTGCYLFSKTWNELSALDVHPLFAFVHGCERAGWAWSSCSAHSFSSNVPLLDYQLSDKNRLSGEKHIISRACGHSRHKSSLLLLWNCCWGRAFRRATFLRCRKDGKWSNALSTVQERYVQPVLSQRPSKRYKTGVRRRKLSWLRGISSR